MVEATVNPKYQRIKDYLMDMSKDNNISEEFIDRFVYNYMNRDKWIQSDVLYEWFGKCHFKHYRSFTQEIRKQLILDIEYRVQLKNAGSKTILSLS